MRNTAFLHANIRCADLEAIRRALADAGMPWREPEVPGDGTVQIILKDPNGIQIESAFARQAAHPT